MENRKHYFNYIGLGFLYLAVKIVFVSFGALHLGALAHGAVPAVLTVLAGYLALQEAANGRGQRLWHWVIVVFPVLTFVITPLYMYYLQGDQWLTNSRLPVLVIYEIIALLQVAISVSLLGKKPKAWT